jgi:hypothetical protein
MVDLSGCSRGRWMSGSIVPSVPNTPILLGLEVQQ